MKIIAHKEGILNNERFIKNAENKEYIHGIILEVTMSSDGKIVVVNENSNYQLIATIQENTFDSIKTKSVLSLDTFLTDLEDFDKEVLIRVVSFDSLVITDKNYEQISKFYEIYIKNIIEVVNRYPHLHISICTVNNSALFHLKKQGTNHKIGLIFEPENLNFIDVDYYIFSIYNFNDVIIEELLNYGKTVMIKLQDSQNLPFIFEHINKSKNSKLLEEKLYIITQSPSVVFNYMNEQ